MPLDRYETLLQRVTHHAEALFERYRPHLRCGFGCYFCCTRISVLPLEYEAIRLKLCRQGYPPEQRLGGPPDDSGAEPSDIAAAEVSVDRSADGIFPHPARPVERCGFLGRHGECTIYEQRPVICRTHGLPLAYTVYEYDQEGRQLEPEEPETLDLWCDLNFTSIGDEHAVSYFDRHGRIDQALINEELERLNEAFLNTAEGARYQGAGRLPLDQLLRQASNMNGS